MIGCNYMAWLYIDEDQAPAKGEQASKGKNKAESSTRAKEAAFEDEGESDVSGKSYQPIHITH